MEAQRNASKAASESRAAETRRAGAERRLAAARAVHDSLSIDPPVEPVRKPNP